MLRELMSLTHDQVERWMHDRADEAFVAFRMGEIERDVYLSICDAAIEQYMLWQRARLLGLLGKEDHSDH